MVNHDLFFPIEIGLLLIMANHVLQTPSFLLTAKLVLSERVTPHPMVPDLPSGKRLQFAIENHHFEWVNQLFLWAIFNSKV